MFRHVSWQLLNQIEESGNPARACNPLRLDTQHSAASISDTRAADTNFPFLLISVFYNKSSGFSGALRQITGFTGQMFFVLKMD